MASGPITSWQISGETVETVVDFIFGGSKITADGDFSHEIKRCLLLERKAMTNIDNVLKGRHQPRQYTEKQIHYLADKSPSSQGYGFFQWSCMDVRVGLQRKLSAEELMLLNCGVGEDSGKFLGLQGDPTSQS